MTTRAATTAATTSRSTTRPRTGSSPRRCGGSRANWCGGIRTSAFPAPILLDVDPDDADRYFGNFPSAIEARAGYERETEAKLDAGSHGLYFFQPFWAVLRDLEPIAIFDAAGVAHTIMGATELMPVYDNIHRNLTITTVQVLGPYLP